MRRDLPHPVDGDRRPDADPNPGADADPIADACAADPIADACAADPIANACAAEPIADACAAEPNADADRVAAVRRVACRTSWIAHLSTISGARFTGLREARLARTEPRQSPHRGRS
jgi:hypothetical protein